MVVGEFTQETNLLVIGGGPGGYAAAFRAGELEVPTLLVDPRPSLGGVCLHEGCVPSKTLLYAAETLHRAEHAGCMGIRFERTHLDVPQLRAWVDQTVDTLARGLETLRKKHGVDLIQGRVEFEDDTHVVIPGGRVPRIKFRRAIVATGSAPVAHPALPFTTDRVLRPTEALALKCVPKSLLVMGSGYMAIELATIFSALGSEVTLITAESRLLPKADADLTRPLLRRLEQSLHAMASAVDVRSATIESDAVRVSFCGAEPPKREMFEQVLVAIEQRAAVSGLHLERAKVTTQSDGTLAVDEHLRTNNPRILAVGDVTGPPLLADKAIHQGRIAAEVVAGWNSAFDPQTVPKVAFTDPQVAWCGLTEEEARTAGHTIKVRKIPWGASGRAVGMGRSDGLTKIIYEKDTKLVLGVGIAGSNAAEMIAEGCLAIEMGAELADLAATIHPHPTMSELLSDIAAEADQSR